MGDCKYYSDQGNMLENIIEYLENRFGNFKLNVLKNVFADKEPENSIFGRLCFMDNNNKKSIFVYLPGLKEINENELGKTRAAESILFVATSVDYYINLFTDIANEFGGYICKNDNTDDDWVHIKSQKEQILQQI